MPNLCDVNVLLALCYAKHVHHTKAIKWLDGIEKPADIVICRITQLGLLRLLSNPSVMREDVHSLKQCWNVFDEIMSDERFFFWNEPTHLESIFRKMTESLSFSHKIMQDAYLAAFAKTSRLNVITFDRDFKKFDGIHVQLLS